VLFPAGFHSEPERGFRYPSVGIPASVEYLLMSALNIILNLILVMVATTDAGGSLFRGLQGCVIWDCSHRCHRTSVVSVVGAAYGAKHFRKICVAHTFSIIFGLSIAFSVSILTGIFAYPIASVFSYSHQSAHLYPAIAAFIGSCAFLSLCAAGSPVVFPVPGCRERTDFPFPDVHEKPCVCRSLCIPVRNPHGHG